MLSISEIRVGIQNMIVRRGLASTVKDVASVYNNEISEVEASGQDLDEILLWQDYLESWEEIRDEIGNACDEIAFNVFSQLDAESLFSDFNLIKRTILPRTAKVASSQFKNQ